MMDAGVRNADRALLRGTGIGLRQPHASELIRRRPEVGWLEVLADNYLSPGGLGHRQLETLCGYYPVALHCVGMSLGSAEAPDYAYLEQIRALSRRCGACIVSDHLCFVSVDGVHIHDLLPLPYTEEALHCTADKIRRVQDFLGQRILIENVSSYFTYKDSEMSEVEFLNEVAVQADCGILLDLNNLYVSAYNHRFEASRAMEAIRLDRVGQIHLGGFLDKGDYLLDAHSRPVDEAVWKLLEQSAPRLADIPILIEWDNELPSLEVLLAEARRAEVILAAADSRSGTETGCA